MVLLDPVEHLAQLPTFGEATQLRGQVLLKGLVALLGLALKGSMDVLLRASAKDRYETYQIGVQAGIDTINECRALEDKPPVPWGNERDDTGDYHHRPRGRSAECRGHHRR